MYSTINRWIGDICWVFSAAYVVFRDQNAPVLDETIFWQTEHPATVKCKRRLGQSEIILFRN